MMEARLDVSFIVVSRLMSKQEKAEVHKKHVFAVMACFAGLLRHFSTDKSRSLELHDLWKQLKPQKNRNRQGMPTLAVDIWNGKIGPCSRVSLAKKEQVL